MHRRSILRTIPCDLKQLPIGAVEAFVLSQVRGHAVVEEVAEVTGLEVTELLRVARRLVQLGALAVDDERPKTKRPSPPPRADRSTARPSHTPGRRSLVPQALVPVARPCADVRALGIGPREGFVLSQIDGATSTEDLGEITGLSARDLSDALRALEAVGVVGLGARKAPATKEVCDLPEEDRARITETTARLEGLDHYATLGIERDADAKTIRRAYHALAAQFHPDRFYGKTLGPFRQPLELVFVRLTRAYDALSKKDRREEYDATLPPQPAKRVPTRKPPPGKTTTRPPGKTPTRRSMRAARPASTPALRPTPTRAPATPPPPAPPPPPAAPAPPSTAQSRPAASSPDPLLRMYADKQRRAVQERVDVFVRAAKEALDRDDVVSAANHYRLAVQCSDDPALGIALEKVDAKARVRIRDKSLAGARAAEQAGRWAEAAEKYAKAYGAHSEAWIAERAANAMRLEGTDLRRAAQLAEQAVLAEPQSVSYRVTLGEIYFAAGLVARAAGEVGRAMAISPNDPRANALSKQLAKAKRE
jgi:tetratricopeptide (TPR) repeat protein